MADDLEFPRQALLVFHEDLDVVVDEADAAEQHGHEEHALDVDVGEVGQEQGRNEDGTQDDDAAHGRGALLLHLAFESEVADDFAYLLELEPFDDAPSRQDGDEQGQHCGGGGPETDVLEQADSWDVRNLLEMVEEVVQHRSAGEGVQGFGQHGDVVEGQALSGDVLVFLVPFPGDEDDVSRLGLHAGGADGFGPVGVGSDLSLIHI